eukprot:scaffold385677_cov22-Prasinocladus_malaysianus.AAC.1
MHNRLVKNFANNAKGKRTAVDLIAICRSRAFQLRQSVSQSVCHCMHTCRQEQNDCVYIVDFLGFISFSQNSDSYAGSEMHGAYYLSPGVLSSQIIGRAGLSLYLN